MAHQNTDNNTDKPLAMLTSTPGVHNGSILSPSTAETAAAVTASLANLSSSMPTDLIEYCINRLTPGEAKTLLTSLLGATNQLGQANLQILSAAAASSNPQRLPSLKPTTSPASVPIGATPTTQVVTPSSGRKRGRPPASDYDDSVKRKKSSQAVGKGGGGEKQNKGLRHFSQLVCEKVREKGTTSYNEVADELVKELGEAERKAGQDGQIDQKNIRRRVYDALNVLMAMNIINKEKKEIQWIGLPTNSVQECEHIQNELSQYEERISKKTQELHELVLQILTLKNLIRRNRSKSESGDPPSHHSAIGLPFILVNTHKRTTIDCSISSDKSEYVFTFDNTFELHQDVEVLNKMGLDCGLTSGKCTPDSLSEAKSMLPKVFEPILDEMSQLSAAPQSPQPVDIASNTVTSTPLSNLPTNDNTLTPLISEHSNGTSSTISASSPQALVAALHNPASIAAALSTLQQLQQQSVTSPFKSGTVTARPLNFASSPAISRPSQSPLFKSNPPPPPVTTTAATAQTKSPVVTVQPLTNLTEMIATLQSSLLRQQQLNNAIQHSENSAPSLSTAGAGTSNGLPSNKLEQHAQEQVEQISTFLTPSNPPIS